MSQFPKARPTRLSRAMPKRPRDWRSLVHVCISGGSADWDGVPLCSECGHRGDHAIRNLNVPTEASEIADRILGESA